MNIKKTTKLLACICWVVVLLIPLLQKQFEFIDTSKMINEKRQKALFPELTVETILVYPDRFMKYFEDNYGLRNLFITINNTIKFHLFDISGSSTFLVGKENWLFYAKENSVNIYKGIDPFTDEELKEILDSFQKRNNYLKNLGIEYIVYMAPDKKSIYSEYYPDNIVKVNKSRYEQLVEGIKQTDITFIDLKKALLEAKNEKTPFFYNQRGTHWNGYGAFVAYEAIVKELKKKFPYINEHKREEFTIKSNSKESSIDTLLNVFFPVTVERFEIAWTKPNPRYQLLIDNEKKYYNINSWYMFKNEIRSKNDFKALIPKALIIRDSFGKLLVPLLGKHINTLYSYSLWPASDFTKDIMDRIEFDLPNVVIHEFVERVLDLPVNDINELISAAQKRKNTFLWMKGAVINLLKKEPDNFELYFKLGYTYAQIHGKKNAAKKIFRLYLSKAKDRGNEDYLVFAKKYLELNS